MSLANRSVDNQTADQQAFAHYLRTGERLTRAEWLARHEVKFNPWHDRLGRFTYGPGGAAPGGRSASPLNHRPAIASSPPRTARTERSPAPPRPAAGAPSATQGNGFRSDFVRNAVAPQTSPADTYFELNKRQAYLDRLRAQAGPHPDPKIAGDLAEFQARLDANRRVLDARYRVADRQTTELLRSGLAPFDVAAGAAAIATGKGELGDYLAVAGVVPGGGAAGKIAKVAKAAQATERVSGPLGGAFRMVRKIQPSGNQGHHLIPLGMSPLPKWEAPAISVLPADHRLFISSSRRGPRLYRYWDLQRATIKKRGIIAALELDARFIRRKVGNKYDAAIEQAIAYGRSIGYKSWLMRFIRSRVPVNLNLA